MSTRKSDELKLIEGNFRPHRARDLPRFSAKVPEPPATLSPAARKHWRELARALADRRTMTAGDRQALALCCTALAAHDAAQAVLAAEGCTYEAVTKVGTVLYRPRPEVRLAADAWSRALRALIELGLTPRARGAVEVARLTRAERERKQMYLALHPETKQGGAPGKAGGGKKKSEERQNGGLRTYTAATAKATGRSERSIQRRIRRANSENDP